MTLVVVAIALVMLLGIAALAIDLTSLYVARDEVQRVVDAAALAGAGKFAEPGGYLAAGATDVASQSTAQSVARQQAIAVAGQNNVAGGAAVIAPANVIFSFTTPRNPRITVTLTKATPTFFARIFGINSVNVGATATAEAIGGSPATTKTICLKPWLLPNCNPTSTSLLNPNCTGSSYLVNPGTGAVVNAGPASSGGVIGRTVPLALATGTTTAATRAGKFYPMEMTGTSRVCPAGAPAASAYQSNVACCNTMQFTCGQTVNLDLAPGNTTTTTGPAVQSLIHQTNANCTGNASSCGQDYISNPLSSPLQIRRGSANPNGGLHGEIVNSSDSIVTVPLYGGGALNATSHTAVVQGFAELFLQQVSGNPPTIQAVVLGVTGCATFGGGGGAGGTGASFAASDSLFTVRLIRP